MTDRELLRQFAKQRSAAAFQPFLDRYVTLVYRTAFSQLGSHSDSVEVTLTVFQVFARKARRLPRKTILAGWLFRTANIAAKKFLLFGKKRGDVGPQHPRSFPPELPTGSSPASVPPPIPNHHLGLVMAGRLMAALQKLPVKLLNPLVLHFFLGLTVDETAPALRVSARRVEKRSGLALKKIQRRLRGQSAPLNSEAIIQRLEAMGAHPIAASDLSQLIPADQLVKPQQKNPLVRSVLRGLAWIRWKRRLKLVSISFAIFIALLAVAGLVLKTLWDNGELMAFMVKKGSRDIIKEVPELAIPAQPWNGDAGVSSAASIQSAKDLYQTTNIWRVHLQFTKKQWKDLEPKKIPTVNFMRPDGTILLRNPRASRNGLAGVLGIDFQWSEGDLDFGGQKFEKAAVRFRGNGTYLTSLFGLKHSFKVDLNKFIKGQSLGGRETLNFNNLIEDSSFLHDSLGYELFRIAGVPAPGTAYAWLTVSVAGQWEDKPLGFYLFLENVDEDFAREHFGSKDTPIFKPVTNELFNDLGSDWAAYEGIYDLKTKATDEQKQRLIDLTRLVTHADEAEFGKKIGEFIDLDEFAGFLGGLVLISSYDSFLSTGQNFYLYLDPRSNKFGFIPWDLDHSWGDFYFVGSVTDREQASIWNPAASTNRFLSRVMGVEKFRQVYRARLEGMLTHAFSTNRLNERIDQIIPLLRDPISADSDYRLKRFEKAVTKVWPEAPVEGGQGLNRTVPSLRRFISKRNTSVRDQLDGKSDGVRLNFSDSWKKPQKKPAE